MVITDREGVEGGRERVSEGEGKVGLENTWLRSEQDLTCPPPYPVSARDLLLFRVTVFHFLSAIVDFLLDALHFIFLTPALLLL